MPTKISKLEVSNFLRLGNIVIVPKGLVMRVTGPNGAGKTSVLKAIRAVNGGESMSPPEPIRSGATAALIRETLLNGNTIERRWSRRRDGTFEPKLEIRDAQGVPQKKPQGLLDGMGDPKKSNLDPLAFIREKPKDQMLTLRRVSDCDLSDVERRHATAYASRTELRRYRDDAEALVFEARATANGPLPRVDLKALLDKQAEIAACEGERARVIAAKDAAAAEVQRTAAILKRINEEHSMAIAASDAAIQANRSALFDFDNLPPPVDASALRAEIAGAEAKNREADARDRAMADSKLKEKAFAEAQSDWEEAEKAVKTIEAERETKIAAAKFPIPGLGFNPNGEGVTYKGQPLEQASGAEKIRVGLAIAMTLAGGLREVIIEDASLLDETSLAIVEEMAAANDCRVWLEEITADGGEIVELKDGAIVEPKARKEARR
jgi:hypothetical protein